MGIAQYHIIVSGRVQGVGYRYSARNTASQLGLTGWVKNRIDGKVEIIAEGDNINLEKFLSWIKKGPRFAKVDSVDIEFYPASGAFTDFSIQ